MFQSEINFKVKINHFHKIYKTKMPKLHEGSTQDQRIVRSLVEEVILILTRPIRVNRPMDFGSLTARFWQIGDRARLREKF